MLRAVPWLMLQVALVGLVGCPPTNTEGHDTLIGAEPISGGSSADEAAVGRSPDARWPFWPVSMRVHPATRITRDRESGQPVLEARVEFADQHGVVTKACGQMTLELRDSAAALGTWNIDLRDLAENRLRFDDITRTYLMRLKLEDIQVPAQPRIFVYFLSSDGAKLTAEHEPRRQDG